MRLSLSDGFCDPTVSFDSVWPAALSVGRCVLSQALSNVRFGAGLEVVGAVDIAPYQPPEQIGLFAATTQRGRGQRRDATLDVGALRR